MGSKEVIIKTDEGIWVIREMNMIRSVEAVKWNKISKL